LEFGGAPENLVHGLGIALVVARVVHPFGLRAGVGPSIPRVIGALTTWVVLLVAGVTAILDFL